MEIDIIARVHTPFKEKFGIPRQSGLAEQVKGEIVFEKKYSDMKAVKGLEGYDYIWLIWEFEGNKQEEFRPMIRPPRLGGNTYMGVFATRSPFRPNPLALSCVKLDGIEETAEGPVIHVSGVDMRDGTPVYDIKPYLPYVDSHPDVRGGFTDTTSGYHLDVVFGNRDDAASADSNHDSEYALDHDDTAASVYDKDADCDDNAEPDFDCTDELIKEGIREIISQDPRPAYQDDENRVYGMKYAGYEVKFRVKGEKAYVLSIENDVKT